MPLLRLPGRPAGPVLPERWATEIPGYRAHTFGHSASGWLFVSDGWGVAPAALRLRQLHAGTGVERATFRTRHQPVGCIVAEGSDLWVAASRRLFKLDVERLEVRAQWDKNLVAYTQQCVPLADDSLLVANWLAPKVGLFDGATGRTSRLMAGEQPVLARADGEAHVFSAVEPAHWKLDRARGRLVPQPTPPVAVYAAVACGELWAVVGGRLEVDRQGDKPIPTRRPSRYVQELGGAWRNVELAADVALLFADVPRNALWAIAGDERERLQLVDARTATVDATFGAPHGGRFVHVAPQLGLALATRPVDGPFDRSLLSAHALPT